MALPAGIETFQASFGPYNELIGGAAANGPVQVTFTAALPQVNGVVPQIVHMPSKKVLLNRPVTVTITDSSMEGLIELPCCDATGLNTQNWYYVQSITLPRPADGGSYTPIPDRRFQIRKADVTGPDPIDLDGLADIVTVNGTVVSVPGVSSIAGLTGPVTLAQLQGLGLGGGGGGTAAATTFTPAGTLAATNVQAAIAELDSEKAPLLSPTSLPIWSDEFIASSMSWATPTGGGTWRTTGPEGGPDGGMTYGHNDYAGSSYNVLAAEADQYGIVTVANSICTIKAIRTPTGLNQGARWTGAYLVSNHLNGLRWKYGYFEWRMRLPVAARGMFPALWLHGSTDNTDAGHQSAEIDAFEVFGKAAGTPYSSGVHTDNGVSTALLPATDTPTDNGWHRYGINWTPTRIGFYKDGIEVRSATDPATLAYYNAVPSLDVRMNYAVDPTFVGATDQTTSTDPASSFVYQMDIDYVRVYAAIPPALPTGTADPLAGVPNTWTLPDASVSPAKLNFPVAKISDTHGTDATITVADNQSGVYFGQKDGTRRIIVKNGNSAQDFTLDNNGDETRHILGGQVVASLRQKRITLPDGSSVVAIGVDPGNAGDAEGAIVLHNSPHVPTTAGTGVGVLYMDGGALKFRGASGTVTTIAPS